MPRTRFTPTCGSATALPSPACGGSSLPMGRSLLGWLMPCGVLTPMALCVLRTHPRSGGWAGRASGEGRPQDQGGSPTQAARVGRRPHPMPRLLSTQRQWRTGPATQAWGGRETDRRAGQFRPMRTGPHASGVGKGRPPARVVQSSCKQSLRPPAPVVQSSQKALPCHLLVSLPPAEITFLQRYSYQKRLLPVREGAAPKGLRVGLQPTVSDPPPSLHPPPAERGPQRRRGAVTRPTEGRASTDPCRGRALT